MALGGNSASLYVCRSRSHRFLQMLPSSLCQRPYAAISFARAALSLPGRGGVCGSPLAPDDGIGPEGNPSRRWARRHTALHALCSLQSAIIHGLVLPKSSGLMVSGMPVRSANAGRLRHHSAMSSPLTSVVSANTVPQDPRKFNLSWTLSKNGQAQRMARLPRGTLFGMF